MVSHRCFMKRRNVWPVCGRCAVRYPFRTPAILTGSRGDFPKSQQDNVEGVDGKMIFIRYDSLSTMTGLLNWLINLFFLWRFGPTRTMDFSFLRFLDHTERYITVGRIPLDEWSAHCRLLYLTAHNTHNRKTSMPQVGFETTISACEWPQK